nr:holo-ACP synthase [Glycomyces tenuis]
MGIDVVAVERFERVLERTPHVADKLFTEAERSTPDGARRRTESLAARFAAKEAVAKALGAPGGMHWADCEILSAADGRPSLAITGSVAEAAAQRGVSRWHVSLSHDGGIATAVVIAEAA